ncbi:MAG: hypothetical protein ACQETJ_09345 [Bacteroidota bacterium]
MKRILLTTLVLLSFLILNYSCAKEEVETPDDLVFDSLISEKDTIAPGESTTVKASATGSNLEFFWSSTLGDIIGSGPEITYVASPCAVGTNEITCKVTNGNQSETKSIEIVVYE